MPRLPWHYDPHLQCADADRHAAVAAAGVHIGMSSAAVPWRLFPNMLVAHRFGFSMLVFFHLLKLISKTDLSLVSP